METIEIQTRDYSFRVSKEWAEKYFEKEIRGQCLSFPGRRPIYSSIEEWAEAYGYDKGQAVYKAALAAGVKPEITFY
jgi:hypothetical protein